MAERKPFQHLPKDVTPVNYDLTLCPDLTELVFTGVARITVKVDRVDTTTVTVNSLDLKIENVVYTSVSDVRLEGTVTYDVESETATFQFPSPLPGGQGVLAMDFTGELNDKMKGFYRSKYTGAGGEERYAAVTQFEATDARRAFPCWDEPAIKATFDTTLIVQKDRVALSNMVVVEERLVEDGKKRLVRFAPTPVMSTYLVAFIVGDYDYVEDTTSEGTVVRVYTPVGKSFQGNFALEVAVKTLPFYNEYFKIPYPLPKLDLIAIADFACGAMENWGLVTYRETALLVDPVNSSASNKQYVAVVVGHEVAHQWFGNLVTMEWWTDLWLNEGFASWIEYLCVDHCYPEFDMWTQFIMEDFIPALELDAMKSSHPIEVPVGHPDEIDEIFDQISYNKGSSVIRMLNDYIGNEAFRAGLTLYLNKFTHKNAVTKDLWSALAEMSGKPVAQVMSTWTSQMGFPLISVKETNRTDTTVTLELSQSRFLADGGTDDENQMWMVPISMSTSEDLTTTVHTVLLDQTSMSVTLENVKPDCWIKINCNVNGFYRTRYSSEMMNKILPSILNQELPATDRLGFLNDIYASAKAGAVSTAECLKFFNACPLETDFSVWANISTSLSFLATLFDETAFHLQFQRFIVRLFQPVCDRVGWDATENEGHLVAKLREVVIRRAGRSNSPAVVAEARKRFEAHYNGTATIHADMRSAVYVTVLSHGDEATFNKFLDLYRKADIHEEKDRIQRTLGLIPDIGLIQRVLEFAISDEVRFGDCPFVIASCASSPAGRDATWAFIQEHWELLYSRLKGPLFERLLKGSLSNFTDEGKIAEMKAFFAARPISGAERTLNQVYENISLRVQILARDTDCVLEYLQETLSE